MASKFSVRCFPGMNIEGKLNIGETKFGDKKLTSKQENIANYYDDQTTKELVDDEISHTNTRFRNLKEKPLSLMTLFDFHKWPLGSQELLGSFGKYSETKDLVCGHLEHFFLPLRKGGNSCGCILPKLFVHPLWTNSFIDVDFLVLKHKA